MRRLAAFIRLSRVYFLPLPMLMYAIGVAWAERKHTPLDAGPLFYGLAIELLIQLSAAYLNDYWDVPTDRINTNRTLLTGGSGELTTGLLPPVVAPVAAGVCQGAALLLAWRAGLPAWSWLLLGAALAVAVFYTTPPIRLAWRGLGEFGTAAVAALVVPQWAYSLQTGHLSGSLFAISLPLLPILMALFVVIAIPDVAADSRVGKRTLPVRLGARYTRVLYLGLLAAGYAGCLLAWPNAVSKYAALLALAGVPFGAAAAYARPVGAGSRRLDVLLWVLLGAMPALIAVLALNWGLRAA